MMIPECPPRPAVSVTRDLIRLRIMTVHRYFDDYYETMVGDGRDSGKLLHQMLRLLKAVACDVRENPSLWRRGEESLLVDCAFKLANLLAALQPVDVPDVYATLQTMASCFE